MIVQECFRQFSIYFRCSY